MLRPDRFMSIKGYPQRMKALWCNYDNSDEIFTEILFKSNDESSTKLTAKGYIKKDRFEVCFHLLLIVLLHFSFLHIQ